MAAKDAFAESLAWAVEEAQKKRTWEAGSSQPAPSNQHPKRKTSSNLPAPSLISPPNQILSKKRPRKG